MDDSERIMEKLDRVLAGQVEFQGKQSDFDRRLGGVEDQVQEVYRTIRGYNGTDGLVTRVSNVEQICALRHETDKADVKGEEEEKDVSENALTWKDIAKDFLLPIGLGAVAYLAFTLIPEILRHLGKVP